ncbi:MAG: histidinol-phosphatase HisJ family protein [Desulfotomaculum sp.]|nr:histidinol-phosphatase HisJ family protein [Desulfotomaculum sp.]
MLIDYHLHTARCGHASGTMDQYIDAARQRGITELGFADHIPMYWLPPEKRDPEIAMQEEELGEYIQEVCFLQKLNPDLGIRLGLEVDYIPGCEAAANKIISELPLDYVLGSVHYLGEWGFDNPLYVEKYNDYDLFELYMQYFDTLCGAAKSGMFDIIAHPDLIKKFNHRPQDELTPLYKKVAYVFADSGVCVEVNTAGLRVPAREIYPAKKMLSLLCKYGVPVTMGSDAHHPNQVGRGLKKALELIKEVGYKEVAVFQNRKRIFYKL